MKTTKNYKNPQKLRDPAPTSKISVSKPLLHEMMPEQHCSPLAGLVGPWGPQAMNIAVLCSAELKEPRKPTTIQTKVVDLGRKTVSKPDETKPKMPGAVPANRHKPTPIDFGPVPVVRPRSKTC